MTYDIAEDIRLTRTLVDISAAESKLLSVMRGYTFVIIPKYMIGSLGLTARDVRLCEHGHVFEIGRKEEEIHVRIRST